MGVYLTGGGPQRRPLPGLQQRLQRREAVLQLAGHSGEQGGAGRAAAGQVLLLHVVQQHKVPEHRAWGGDDGSV